MAGSATKGVVYGTTPVHTDYLTAIQPTLVNGGFATGLSGWERHGAVLATSVNPASSIVTLGESTPSSTGQTHLSQSFMLSSQDRFLTFTVNSLNLQNNSKNIDT